MVSFVKDGEAEKFVCAAGILSHYVGDACQPLHISYMFNGDPDHKVEGDGARSERPDEKSDEPNAGRGPACTPSTKTRWSTRTSRRSYKGIDQRLNGRGLAARLRRPSAPPSAPSIDAEDIRGDHSARNHRYFSCRFRARSRRSARSDMWKTLGASARSTSWPMDASVSLSCGTAPGKKEAATPRSPASTQSMRPRLKASTKTPTSSIPTQSTRLSRSSKAGANKPRRRLPARKRRGVRRPKAGHAAVPRQGRPRHAVRQWREGQAGPHRGDAMLRLLRDRRRRCRDERRAACFDRLSEIRSASTARSRKSRSTSRTTRPKPPRRRRSSRSRAIGR